MTSSQSDLFETSESDEWFKRNREALDKFDPEVDLPSRVLKLYGLRPRRILEVGASSGFRVASLAKHFGAEGFAIEPSQAAIDFGTKAFPAVKFARGMAHDLPTKDSFDLVIVNLVLHWVGRRELMRSIAELDRVVADGGHLLIGDFVPFAMTRVPYHHVQSVEAFTFKQDYAGPFLASGLYERVALLTANHADQSLVVDVPEQSRYGVSLMQKRLEGRHVEKRLVPSNPVSSNTARPETSP